MILRLLFRIYAMYTRMILRLLITLLSAVCVRYDFIISPSVLMRGATPKDYDIAFNGREFYLKKKPEAHESIASVFFGIHNRVY